MKPSREIVLIHWNAVEGEARAAGLRAAGYGVAVLAPAGSHELRPLRERPPSAVVIDLTRLPSQGRAVALELRRTKAARAVPVVFAGGEPEKVARIRALLPDAFYAEWSGIAEAVAEAVANPPAAPAAVKEGGMAGYSGTPLAKKLRIVPGARVALLNAPEDFASALAPLPEGVRFLRRAHSAAIVMLFARSGAELRRRFPAASRAVADGGGLWLVWPKKASGVSTGLTEPAVRAFGLAAGWVDYKICAVDRTWSGLLFARRRS